MEHLQDQIAELFSGDDERAEAAVKMLAAAGPLVVSVLKEMLESPEVDRRWWAARALAEISHLETVPLLIGRLQDQDPSVRQCAALGLRKQPDARAVPPLIEKLEDEDHLTASLAADALAVIGQPAVLLLLEVLEKGSLAARVEAVRALAKIGDTRAIPALVKVLDEDSAILEYWAVEGLERMGVGMLFYKP